LCGYVVDGAGVAVAAHDATDPTVERQLAGLFHLERLAGRGPVSCVYVAREATTDRVIALKVIPRAALQAEAFRSTMATAAALDHPHIVSVYRYGTTPTLFWYSMQCVEGRSLAETLGEVGRLDLPACLRVIEQVAGALHYAHCRGVTHGNLKPANVLVGPGDWVLVGDFALARAFEAGDAAGGRARSSRLPGYIAPEERHTRHPGPAMDQYALAMLILECLQGTSPPTTAADLPRLVDARLDVPAYVWGALARATSREPAARFPSVLDLMTVLESGPPPPRAIGSGLAPGRVPPPLLWDAAYEPAVPPPRAARFVRWLGIAALSVALLVAVGAVVAWWAGRSPGVAGPELVAAVAPPAVPADTAAPPVARGMPPAAGRAPGHGAPTPAVATVGSRPRFVPRRALAAPGRLFVSATPWGELSVDDQAVGHTPMAGVAIAPGRHRLRIERDGFESFAETIEISPGQDLRLTGILLRELKP